ncbi:ovoinhibitor-like [Varanus komodoensis]|uniref:ovoinhibitor-like n=1 Tax=Varanus komodoensis TaxID=61221 RepID=UPI001CF7A439|nr:ovoinhibitor-like [Varanus komodoensis]
MLMADGSQVDCDNQVRIIQEDDSERIVCPYIIKQVCGTDGKTYSNECEICRHNLETGENVGKKFNGKCSKKACGKYTGPCPRIPSPVCGTDGTTYGSECTMCKINDWNSEILLRYCKYTYRQRPTITWVFGSFKIEEYCKNYSAQTEICPMIYQPHCGSDGETYGSQCNFCISALYVKR